MIRIKCDKCGLSYPKSDGHRCADGADKPPAANDNIPFDYAAWRKKYMREYMVKYRRRVKEMKQAALAASKEET